MQKAILFIITSKVKYLEINLTREVKDLYIENYETALNKVKEDLKKWKHFLCSWIGRLPQIDFRFNVVPVKVPVVLFKELDKIELKFLWKCKAPRIIETIFKKENKKGGLICPHPKIYYKIILI